MSDEQPVEDNLEAAMAQVAATIDPTVSRDLGKPGAPVTKQVLIRAVPHDADRWKQAADKLGQTMSDFIRTTLNDKAAELLDCSHPIAQRLTYPWSEQCLRCGLRLR